MTSKTYTIKILNRTYSEWQLSENIKEMNPFQEKLFSNDTFSLNDENECSILDSPVRKSTYIAGVLVLKNNKTYGRSVNGKLLYKCIPNNIELPCFLIPYELKNMGFSKVFKNQYITFCYHVWNDKHPHGVMSQLIGPVDVLENFYEYQLYCKNLNVSLQNFKKETSKAIQVASKDNTNFYEKISSQHYAIEDRTSWKVFSIDPEKCQDFDDACSIQMQERNGKPFILLSIYIANVPLLLDSLQLWNSFSQRVSTIYLPDKKRTMLPSVLSDNLCSLQSNASRFAFVMDIFLSVSEEPEVVEIKYANCKINLYKNYCYDEPKLLRDENYKLLLDTTTKLSRNIKYLDGISDSHDVVAYLMIFMNHHVAKELVVKYEKKGIFRGTIAKETSETETSTVKEEQIPAEINNFIKIWNHSMPTKYIVASKEREKTMELGHKQLGVEAYVHITSPIRRLVDLLNMIKFQEVSGLLVLSPSANDFYERWILQIDYINATMKGIRRVQNECELLHMCSMTQEIMTKTYDGYIIEEKAQEGEGEGEGEGILFEYMVYLPVLRITSKAVLREKVDLYGKHKFKLYLFDDEDKLKKKIRLQKME